MSLTLLMLHKKHGNVLVTEITSVQRMLEYYLGSTTDKLEEWDNTEMRWF